MKTIVKDGQYLRLENNDAELKVKVGWKYCPKSEWKNNVRDINKPSPEDSDKAEKKTKREKKH